MKIGIIGAGFTGLAAAHRLSKAGHNVVVFESGNKPGGLAVGFKEKNWEWTLEHHYHHLFTNDNHILDLAREIGHEVLTVRPKTSTLIDGYIYQLDSPLSLLKFRKLSLVERLRTGFVLAYLKFSPFWRPLEGVTSKKFLLKWMGIGPWKVLWKPLFEKKFSNFADNIPASWFWARIKKRTPSLSYPSGGFWAFAESLEKSTKSKGARFYYETEVKKLYGEKGKVYISTLHKNFEFDSVICTLPTPLFFKVAPSLPKKYINLYKPLKGIGATNLVLRLKTNFLRDGTYWLNVNEDKYPFLAVVEHTNFMNKEYYGNEHVLYIGNYLESGHRYFKIEADDMFNEFLPYLKKINPNFSRKDVVGMHLFKASFAQPIIPLNYSKNIPPHQTPIKNVFLANIQQVYPWDRGTNYAVELGEKVANLILKDEK